jgi:hypothetical protein
VDFVEEDEAQDLSDSWDASQEVEGAGVVAFGLPDDVEFQLSEETVIEIEELEIHLDAFLDAGIGEVLGDSVAVCLVGQLFLELGEIVLAVGVLDVGEKFGAFSHEVVAAS